MFNCPKCGGIMTILTPLHSHWCENCKIMASEECLKLIEGLKLKITELETVLADLQDGGYLETPPSRKIIDLKEE